MRRETHRTTAEGASKAARNRALLEGAASVDLEYVTIKGEGRRYESATVAGFKGEPGTNKHSVEVDYHDAQGEPQRRCLNLASVRIIAVR